MKILVPMHIFNNFGGIINHTEELIAGLRDLGHEVSFCLLKPTANLQKGEVDKKTLPEGYEYGVGTQVPVHQGKGWITDYFSFKNKEHPLQRNLWNGISPNCFSDNPDPKQDFEAAREWYQFLKDKPNGDKYLNKHHANLVERFEKSVSLEDFFS